MASSMLKFQGKSALITGGSSGIGLALAEKLSAQGANVCLLARDLSRLEAARQQVTAARLDSNQKIDIIQADVAAEEQVQAALSEYVQRSGVPDLLINSAGITQPGYFTELDLSIFRSLMEVNYFGTLNVLKALVPAMIKRGSGYIVNISSLVGFLSVYGYSAYGPTKFAVRGLTDTMRYELAEHGIRVSIVFPPDTQTPQLDYESQFKPPILVELDKSNKILQPDVVADAILKGVARGKYVITPGFDSSLYYHLTNFFGLVYPVMDFMVSQARRAVSRSNGNGAAQNDNSH